MLLLNLVDKATPKKLDNFNTSYVVIKRIICCIMELNTHDFNTSYVVIKQLVLWALSRIAIDFNTSYVVIKLSLFINNESCIFISIHLMLLLNFCRSFSFNDA